MFYIFGVFLKHIVAHSPLKVLYRMMEGAYESLGVRFGVWGLGFGVWGLGFRV